MKLRIIAFFMNLFVLFCLSATFSQEFVDVIDETFTVNSSTALTGYTRNKTSVTLPAKTTGYIYRITVAPKGNIPESEGLLDLLEQIGPQNISMGVSLARIAIKNNDNSAVDAYIFSNTYDADDFYSKNDDKWSACKSMPNRVNCCFSTSQCMGENVYFGFRNNNIRQGLDVRLEIVALVDANQGNNHKYPFSIINGTESEMKFLLSADNVDWTETSLRSNYHINPELETNSLYIKIFTDASKVVFYKLEPYERYKIVWNAEKQRWDLARY